MNKTDGIVEAFAKDAAPELRDGIRAAFRGIVIKNDREANRRFLNDNLINVDYGMDGNDGPPTAR